MSEVGVYKAPSYQWGFLTPLLILVVTVFGSHRGGATNPLSVADLAFDTMNDRIHSIRQVRTIEYADAPPEAARYLEP